jgi:hypothetical protein
MNCQSIREAIDTATRRSGYNETVAAHLTGCPDCNHHASEMSSLLALLGAQPRVEAPADFDFRLRARIARAQSEPKTALGWFEKVWAGSFSLGQAATAMAAIMVAVMVSTFYFTNTNEATGTGDNVATNVVTPPAEQPATSDSKPDVAVTARPASGRASVASSRPKSVAPQPARVDVAVAKSDLPDASSRLYSRTNRQVITASLNRGLVGAEGAELAKAQTVALSF